MKILLFDLLTSGHHLSYASYLARYLREAGDEVLFVTAQQSGAFQVLQDRYGVKVEYLAINKKLSQVRAPSQSKLVSKLTRNLRTAHHLIDCFRLANRWQVDVVHILCLDDIEPALYIAHLKRQFSPEDRSWSLWGTLHSPYFVTDQHSSVSVSKRFQYYLKLTAIRRVIANNSLSGIFVHTSGIRETLLKALGNKEEQVRKVKEIPYPVELLSDSCSMKDARKKLGLPQDIPLLLFFGGLRYNKGLDIVIDAIRDLDDTFQLVIAGQPEYFTKSHIEDWLASFKDPSKVICRLRYIPEEEVKYYFLSADAVILAHKKNFKGQSGPLLQACAAGKPVISTDVGEIGNIVKENGLGMVVEPDSTEALRQGIKQFLDNRAEMSREVYQRTIGYAHKHDWHKMGSVVRKEYFSTINSSRMGE